MRASVKTIRVVWAALLLIWSSSLVHAQEVHVYLVRHAEKDKLSKDDPALTERGQARSMQWVSVFEHTPIAAVYSTDTRRTRDTAEPLAHANQLDVTLYEVGSLNAESLLQMYPDKTVFVVGHSNTTPLLANKLSGKQLFSELDESEYGDLFRVTVSSDPLHSSAERLTIPLAK